MRPLGVASVLALAGCAARDIPPERTPYFDEQLALARAAPAAGPRTEGESLLAAVRKLEPRAATEADRMRRAGETEGLLAIETPVAREFLAILADPGAAEEALSRTPLDLERLLLAVYARNPDVAAARGHWAAAVRMYDQATYLEELLLRYSAFARRATPAVGGVPMSGAVFPYPGLVALKGEMIDREVAIARETTRVRLRDAMVAAAKAYHAVRHHDQELSIRTEQAGLARRVVDAARARVASGQGSQAELLEMEADLAAAENDRVHAVAARARALGELNTLLARDPGAPLRTHDHGDPPVETPPLERYLALARRYSPEVRVARAETERSAVAIRMAESMLFAAPSPGSVASAPPMPDAGPPSGGLPPRDEPPRGVRADFGADVAWVAEIKERRVASERAAEEASRSTERAIVDAHYELDAARRMHVVATKSSEPLSSQAVEERIRLYEAGRGDFAALAAALRRRLDAAHAVAASRHEYRVAEAMLWRAAGARPEVVHDDAGRRSDR